MEGLREPDAGPAPTARTPPAVAGPLGGFASLSRWQKTSRLVFCGTVLIVLGLGTICLVDAVRLVGEPFPGFLVNQRMIPSNFGRPHWTGPEAGLRYPDKILKANDHVLASRTDLLAVLRETAIGEPILYAVERNGEVIQVPVRTMRFTWTDLALTFGPTFLAGILYLLIAIVVYVLKPDTGMTWAFVLSCLFIGAYQLVTFDVASTHRFVRMTLLLYAFIPAAGIHLSLLFPQRKAIADRFRAIQVVPYLVSTVLVIPLEWLYPRPAFATVYALTRLYLVLSIVAVLASVLHAFFRGLSPLARQRAKVVLAGAAVAFPIPAVVNNLSLLGSTPGTVQVWSTFLPFPLLFFPASISYAIARHNLFDVDVYLKRAVGYILMTAVVGLAYFSVQTVVSTLVLKPVFGAQAENVYPIIFALLVVFFFNPINRRVQEGVEKLFFRKQYDYKATVATVSDALTSLLNLDAIITKVLYTVREKMFLDKAAVILLDPSRRACQTLILEDAPASAQGPIPSLCLSYDDPLLALLAREKKLITKYDIAEDPRYAAVRESCGRAFSKLGASLAIPLLHQNTFTGVLTLGHKKSGHFYSRDDIDLLKTISTMTATAIEQAREKEQRGVLMQLFSKHVSPQVAESLWHQRDQFLDGGRPRSQKLAATVMFTDLQGFTGVSEKLDPQALLDWLNTYMEAIARTVMEHGGVVDDYFGDGVKVNFGVPVPRTTEAEISQDAVNAVNCALALEEEMRRLNARMNEKNLPTLRMRVGIFTGPVVAGSLGSADRLKYTTLGDTVNTASRLESFDKELELPHLATSPCRILLGESTLPHLGSRFITQRVGEMALKGKESKITAYCVLGREAAEGAAQASREGESFPTKSTV